MQGEPRSGSKEAQAQRRVLPKALTCCRLRLLPTPRAGPAFEGSVGYDLPPERQTTMQQTAASSGQTLRQMGGGGAAAPADARLAAAEAALRRSGAAVGAAQGPASAGAQQQQQQQQQFRKGDRVLYRQRDGSLVEATVGGWVGANEGGRHAPAGVLHVASCPIALPCRAPIRPANAHPLLTPHPYPADSSCGRVGAAALVRHRPALRVP